MKQKLSPANAARRRGQPVRGTQPQNMRGRNPKVDRANAARRAGRGR